jgi:hypothetical protein
MSTVAALSKKLAAWEATLTGLSERCAGGCTDEAARAVLVAASTCAKEISSTEPDIAKLVAKIDHKDPVSGQPRYGAEAKAKITSFDVKIAELKDKCNSILHNVEAVVTSAGPPTLPVATTLKFKPPVAGPLRSVDQEFTAIDGNNVHQGASEHASPELVEKARLVRERKARDAVDGTEANEAVGELLRSHISFLESVRQHHTKMAAMKDGATVHLADPLQLLRQQVLHR